jgi:nucleotide-binding universal stress UspA family protein
MFRRILVPLDGSVAAERGLRAAIALAAGHGANLFLLNVVEDVSLGIALASTIGFADLVEFMRERGWDVLAQGRRTAERTGVHAELILRQTARARVADVILNEARKGGYDLIVMGIRGRRGLARLVVGSDAGNVVRASPIPVLLVRQE